jgi:hypothetical protein
MSVEQHLASGERLVASYGDFHATDRRLIRCTATPTGEEVDSLDYKDIKSFGLIIQPKLGLVWLGLGISIVGMFVGNARGMPTQVGLVLVLGGAAVLFYGFMSRKFYLEFRSPAVDKKARSKWRLPDPRNRLAQEFLQVVRERLPEREKRR